MACGDDIEGDAVLDAFADALLDCGAGGSRGDAAAAIKRAFNVFVRARVAQGDDRETAIDEAKIVLSSLRQLRDQEEG